MPSKSRHEARISIEADISLLSVSRQIYRYSEPLFDAVVFIWFVLVSLLQYQKLARPGTCV